ncbi:rhomboid family intramembrane serine protease [Spongiivirga citrea]|uniref:Rhomboid family intramembrane serine protease n=1 Tax=Spongiivirga citrea TaxID=1481457 RepID=A0A6M0CP20_9FLAO|nr:rhomboid family intramembrane serine protease [Spongiivirga citrea]NER15680.1 rhomboid family intramembrane serine protease [Spongiivirga citrea]
MFRITDTVKHLLIINVIVFIALQTPLLNSQIYDSLVLHFPLNERFRAWQIFTHMFMHLDLNHLFFNMLILFFVGSSVEQVLGRRQFIFLYISAGLGSALLSVLTLYVSYIIGVNNLTEFGMDQESLSIFLNEGRYNSILYNEFSQAELGRIFQNYNSSSLGASGALFGILVAFAIMFPNAEFFPIPIKAKYMIPSLVIADFLSGLISEISFVSMGNTGYFGHVGGAITGLIMMWYWKKNQFNKNRWN